MSFYILYPSTYSASLVHNLPHQPNHILIYNKYCNLTNMNWHTPIEEPEIVIGRILCHVTPTDYTVGNFSLTKETCNTAKSYFYRETPVTPIPSTYVRGIF